MVCVLVLFFLLRQECSKLREELRLQHEEDKKSAMTQLLQLKEREKNAARDSWQKKVEDLLDQVTGVIYKCYHLLYNLKGMYSCGTNSFRICVIRKKNVEIFGHCDAKLLLYMY